MSAAAAARSWPAAPVKSPQALGARLEIPLLLALTLLFFWQLFGLRILDPTNTAWLLQGDPAQHQLGWEFFRAEPWRWPPGRLADYALPGGTSIVFSDSLPLLALPLKLLQPLLPANFQYFGLWLLGCYLAMALAARQLLQPWLEEPLPRLIACLFFVLSGPLLMRGWGHEALAAQALILLAFHALLQQASARRWALLLALAALIHAYLLAMLLGLWLAACLPQLGLPARRRSALHALFFIPPLLALLMYLAGYFIPSSRLSAAGYGFFSMNLLALIQPNFLDASFGHSPLWTGPAVATGGQYEGYLYLGAGVLLLGPLALLLPQPARAADPALRGRFWALAGICLLFWLAAASKQISWGGQVLYELPVPPALEHVLAIFRASGRFGWPLYYLILLALFIRLARLPGRWLGPLLLAALLLQGYELSPKVRALHKAISARQTLSSPLTDPRWPLWGAQARQLTLFGPPATLEARYIPFAALAARFRLATNAAHPARAADDLAHWQAAQLHALIQEPARSDTLYVFLDEALIQQLPGRLQNRLERANDVALLAPYAPD